MKRRLPVWLLVIGVVLFASHARAETETIDLKALAKKARPAVMLLVVSDAAGKEIATGTGFLVSSDGKLITNHHVIENAASAVAKAENGGLFPIDGVLADDPKNDLVLLKLKGKDLPFLTLGNSDKIEVGTRIAVIGSPLGLEGTLSEGIVSAVRDMPNEVRILQISAAISPGSSGSPVLNSRGQVIGVATALMRAGQALNFAIPVEAAHVLATRKDVFDDLALPFGGYAGNEDDPIMADPDYKAAFKAAVAKDQLEALKRIKIVLSRYPEDAQAYVLASIVYAECGFENQVLESLEHATKLDPKNARAWFVAGDFYLKNCCGSRTEQVAATRLGKAAKCFERFVQLEPENWLGWNGLTSVYFIQGDCEKALRAQSVLQRLVPERGRKVGEFLREHCR